jgi:protein-tyrosine-phosphatase
MGPDPEVLFVCVLDAGRSQMGAAVLDHYAQGRIHVPSTGSTPAGEINPAVVTVVEEIGLDLSKEFPKPLTTDIVEAADVVITMGWADACPVFPGKRYLDWELPDPAGKSIEFLPPSTLDRGRADAGTPARHAPRSRDQVEDEVELGAAVA